MNKDIYDNEDEEASPSEMESVVVTFIASLAMIVIFFIILIAVF